jgi:hypothetical protein
MSLRTTLVLIGLSMGLLYPVGLLLKDQNPWNCRPFTVDEASFIQATENWAEGRGFRMSFSGPFDPIITVGIPLAWGATAVSKITGLEISHSGRIFVYLTFILTLILLARTTLREKSNWFSIALAVGIFAFGLTKFNFGGYFVFGFLGEMPALFLGVVAYRELDRKRFFWAGVWAANVFLMKSTYLFFLPAVGLACLFESRRATFRLVFGATLTLLIAWSAIASVRGESLFEYLKFFASASVRIASVPKTGSIFDFFPGIDAVPLILSVTFLIHGALSFAIRKFSRPSVRAAVALFVISNVYYLSVGGRPIEKHWTAIFIMTLLGFVVPWSVMISKRFFPLKLDETFRVAFLTIALTWIFAVGPNAYHRYKRTSEYACPSKELTAINARLRTLIVAKEVRRENLGALIQNVNFGLALYSVDWLPTYLKTWTDFNGTIPKWVFGESGILLLAPLGCAYEFKGETYSLLRCGS